MCVLCGLLGHEAITIASSPKTQQTVLQGSGGVRTQNVHIGHTADALPVSVLDSFFSTARDLTSNMSVERERGEGVEGGGGPRSLTQSWTGSRCRWDITSCPSTDRWCPHTPSVEGRRVECQRSNSPREEDMQRVVGEGGGSLQTLNIDRMLSVCRE